MTRALAAGCMLLWSAVALAQDHVISAREAWADLDAGRLVLIDVRSPDEWAVTGAPRGAMRLSIEQSFGDDDFVDEVLARLRYDRSTVLAVICSGAARSRRARDLLAANGFSQAWRVREGVRGSPGGVPGWAELGLPMEP